MSGNSWFKNLFNPSSHCPPPRGIYSVRFEGIRDHYFSNGGLAPLVWTSPLRYGGRDSIMAFDGAGPGSGSRTARLAHALDTHRRQPPGGGWLVYSDAIVCVPSDLYEQDAEVGFHDTYALQIGLAALHQRDFGDCLVDPKRGVNYVVVPVNITDSIVVMFGLAVFVPGSRDRLKARLSVRLVGGDGGERWSAEPAWPVLRDVNGHIVPDTVPAGHYEDQRFLLVGGSLGQATIALPEWLGTPKGSVHIDTSATGLDAAAGRGDGGVLARQGTLAADPATGARIWSFPSAVLPARPGDQPDRLDVHLVPVRPAPSAPPPAAPRPSTPSSGPSSRILEPATDDEAGHGTVVIPPSAFRTPPVPERHLEIAALALLRIDGAEGVSGDAGGLDFWRLPFDSTGGLVTGTAETAALTVGARWDDGALRYALPGQQWQKAPVEGEVSALPLDPSSGRTLMVHRPPPELAPHLHGLLRLSDPVALPLPAGRFVIGRPGGPSSLPLLPLGLLEIPGTLSIRKRGGTVLSTVNRINLSRHHVSAIVAGQTLEVTMLDGTTPVWRIDEDGTVAETRIPTAPEPLVLAPGEGLLIGSYLLRWA